MLHQVQAQRTMQKKDHMYNHSCNCCLSAERQRYVANQIHRFTVDYSKFTLKIIILLSLRNLFNHILNQAHPDQQRSSTSLFIFSCIPKYTLPYNAKQGCCLTVAWGSQTIALGALIFHSNTFHFIILCWAPKFSAFNSEGPFKIFLGSSLASAVLSTDNW